MNLERRRATRSLRSLGALLKVREKESQDAQVKLRGKHMEIARVKRELVLLAKRRENVIRRGGAHVLKERLLIDALMKIALERRKHLQSLRLEAARILETWREACGRRDVVQILHGRERARMDAVAERRADEAAADMAATRKFREGRPYQEEGCEE